MTWVDWTLIGFGIFLCLHMPALMDMREDADQFNATHLHFMEGTR